MKAAVWHGYKDIRIEEVPKPVPEPDQLLVKVDYAGICGTDRHEYVGPNFIPTARPHRLTGRTAPLIIGHEFAGVVEAVGSDVQGYRAGDSVTANGTLACGVCEMCRTGRYNICRRLGFMGVGDDGCFAEYVAVDADRAFLVPEGVTNRQRRWRNRSRAESMPRSWLATLQGSEPSSSGPASSASARS